jgi:phosphatidylglycerophosphatase C
MVEVAAFDVDGTLTQRDCVVPFMRRSKGTLSLATSMSATLPTLAPMLIRRDRDAIKKTAVRHVFRGANASEVNGIGVEFASDIASGWMRTDVASRLRWHQEQGHVVVLVSASLGPYLHPLGDMLEVDAVLCTELEESSGVLTGELDGANCRGPEKVVRLNHWLSQAGLNSSDLRYAYGDSAGDVPMLEMATHGLNVARIDVEAAPR